MTKSLPRFITLDGSIISKQIYGGGPRMTKTLMPEAGGDGEAGVWSCRAGGDGVQAVGAIAAKNHATGRDILNRKTEKQKASNSIVQLLSFVNWRTESKLRTREGTTRTL